MEQYKKRVLEHFYRICEIPHGSGNTKAICNYLKSFADSLNLWNKVDSYGNIIIKKNGTSRYENLPPVIIQGHMDMVCERSADCNIDFEKDGLNIKTDGDYIYAEGTTLGGDDGIAIAYALALLERSDILHPPLEVIITSDEEIGMLGAMALDTSDIEGKVLLNIDSEEEGVLLTSCAGGITAKIEFPLELSETEYPLYELKISGLTGGHSGVEIHKGNANSNILMGRVLYALGDNVHISSINGGLKDNAVPRETTALISVNSVEAVKKIIEKVHKDIKNEYSVTDKDLKITFKETKTKGKIIKNKCEDNIRFFLHSVPDGVTAMSKSICGLVETSLNFGILKTDDTVECKISIRSSVESAKYELTDKIRHIAEFACGSFTTEGDYPGWEYRENSRLRAVMTEVFEKQYGYKPKVNAIHAGLECGILCGKILDLDCVSFGPDIYDIHTVSEKMSISSVYRTADLLIETLKMLCDK